MNAVPFPSPFDSSAARRGFLLGVVFRGHRQRTPRLVRAEPEGDGNGRQEARSKKEPESLGKFPGAAPWGRRGRAHGVGGGFGAATPLTLIQSAEWQADGMKDAGEPGARTAPPSARAGIAVSVTGSPFSWPTMPVMCHWTGPPDGQAGQAGGGGHPHRGSCEAGAGVGRQDT